MGENGTRTAAQKASVVEGYCPVPAIFTSSEDRNPGCGCRVPADASSIRHRWLRVRWGADSDHSEWDGTGRNRWYRTSTCVLHGVEPRAYLADVIVRVNWPDVTVDELLPWNWKPEG